MPLEREKKHVETIAWVTALAIVTWLAFAPALSAGFVNWDDGANILENQAFRGFSSAHLEWMFTTTHLGPYQPLSWLSLALDHEIGGLDAGVYHRTNLLWHVTGAIALFWLSRVFFTRALRLDIPTRALEALCFASALLFAVHPLRCESVCWVTERRDVLSAPFFFAALACWIVYATSERGRGRAFYALSLVLCFLSLLAKASAVVMPAVLVLLDLWPLRTEARARGLRSLVAEKLPFLALTIVFVVVAIRGQASDAVLASAEMHGALSRAIQAGYAALFYVARTAWPGDLIPIHELPPIERFFDAAMIVPALVTLAVTVLAVVGFKKRPALALTWLAFLVILAPVSGLVHAGPQLVADRYSYLACVPFALLVAYGFVALAAHSKMAAILAFASIATGLVHATRTQALVWHDSESLWEHTLAIEPANAIANANLATFELEAGQAESDPRRALERLRLAVHHSERALAVRQDARWLYNLSAARFQLARREPARRTEHMALAVEQARAGRALAMARQQKIEPRWNVIHAVALLEAERAAEALPLADEARAALPLDVEVMRLAANARIEVGRHAEAIAILREALRGARSTHLLWYDLSRAAERMGDATAARDAARSGRDAADRELGQRARELPWYAELVRRAR